MISCSLSRAFQDPLPAPEELRAGRAFVLMELDGDERFEVAKVVIHKTEQNGQALVVSVFVLDSTNEEALPPGEIIARRVSLAKPENRSWTLAPINCHEIEDR